MVISPERRKPKKQSKDADHSMTLSNKADGFEARAKRRWCKRLGVTGSHFGGGSLDFLASVDRIPRRTYSSLGMSWIKGSGCD